MHSQNRTVLMLFILPPRLPGSKIKMYIIFSCLYVFVASL